LQAGRVLSVLNLGAALELRRAPGHYGSQPKVTYLGGMRSALASSRTRFSGLVLCNDNQLSLVSKTSLFGKLALPNSFLYSGDDVSFQQDQVRSVWGNAFQIADVLAVAATCRVIGNRVQEVPGKAVASIAARANMLNVSDNMTTHCVFAITANPMRRVVRDNLLFIEHPEDICAPMEKRLMDALSGGNVHLYHAYQGGSDEGDRAIALLASLMQELHSERTATTSAYGERLSARASAWEANTWRYAAKAGSMEPKDERITARVERYAQVVIALREQMDRERTFITPESKDWSVTGQVVTAGQEPAAGLRAILRSTRLKDMQGEATTNAHGDFQMIFDQCGKEEALAPDQPMAFTLTLLSKLGKEVASYPIELMPKAGGAEHLEVVLEQAMDAPSAETDPHDTTKKKPTGKGPGKAK
jgi:hypothetical protein